MIRNESEYREAVGRIAEEKQRLDKQQAELESMGLTPEQLKRALDPIRSFHLQIQEEVARYERLKRGEFGELLNLRGIGHLLIALRIARGMSQRELAAQLGVHETQVSRDERNEYHGIKIERAQQILEVFGAEVRSTVELRPSPQPQLQPEALSV